MSGWLSSLGGGGGSRFQPHPSETLLRNAARVDHNPLDEYAPAAPVAAPAATPAPAPTSASSKAAKIAGVGVGLLTAEETFRRLHDSPMLNKVATVISQAPELVQNATAATGEKVKEVTGSAFETVSSYCSWSTFGLGFMSYMPHSVQYLVGGAGAIGTLYGLGLLIGLYRSCRYPNGQVSTTTTNTVQSDVNLHFHGIPDNCTPVAKTRVRPDGSKDVDVQLHCEAKAAAPQPQQKAIPAKKAKELNSVGVAAVPAMKMIPTAKAYHQRLHAIVENLGALSKPVQKQVKGLNLHFDKLAERKYVAKSLGSDLAKARLLLDDVDKMIAKAAGVVGAMDPSKKRAVEDQVRGGAKKAKLSDYKVSK